MLTIEKIMVVMVNRDFKSVIFWNWPERKGSVGANFTNVKTGEVCTDTCTCMSKT